MKDNNTTNPQPATPPDDGLSPWQRLKTKHVSYFTLPLLIMATVVEFVILATGWKYQKTVCMPQGMGVTFFGIGPIGATILAVELLKLPLAIWTASRQGAQKTFMLFVGLPLICVLTFQLVKDMAVYEMGVAMTPASQLLEKASVEETKIDQLKGDLSNIEQKKKDREQKLAELTAKRDKAKADHEEALKRNDESRQDAISLTDYQKKEVYDAEARQATITKQFNADADQLTKAIAELRARGEKELPLAAQWNAEEARIENEYKTKLSAYSNKKSAYEKAKAEYDAAGRIKRALLMEPIDPGVPPVREANKILKPTVALDLDTQIKTKEAELTTVNNKRREAVAQVDADARRIRQDFDQRSRSKRAETDTKRDALMAANTKLSAELKEEEKQIDEELSTAVQKVDGIRAELDASQKTAEKYYEAREAAIRNTQVHRIATTVEIVRGLIRGERPMSIRATAKERGDILTDQISMVRIWVYPVLAFIVAFLPTLMVEIGFSTVFKPEQKQPAYRLGFMGRRLHWLYTRAGRIKILRAERLAKDAEAKITARDRALATKEKELQAAHENAGIAGAQHEERLTTSQSQYEEQLKAKESEWVAKLGDLAESLNKAVGEKDALRDLQKSEIERQIQMRQNAWSDRMNQLRQELDAQRTASEAERTAAMAEHHKKLMEVSEESKSQVIQARRQASDAEMAAMEKTARLTHDLTQAQHDRNEAERQFKQQADQFALKLTQAREEASRQTEKAVRQEKHRIELQQLEFEKNLANREENFEQRLKQREQELLLDFESRLAEEKSRTEQGGRREADLKQQFETQSRDANLRLKQELQDKEQAFQARLKQHEQEGAIKAENRETELQKQSAADLRHREEEWERQIESRVRDAEIRMAHDAQQKEELFLSKTRQRDQQWQVKLDAARAEAQAQAKDQLRRRDAEADASVRELEAKLRREMQQKEEATEAKAREREMELIAQMTAQFEAREAAVRQEWDTQFQVRTREVVEPFKNQLARIEKERDEARQSADQVSRHAQTLEKKLSDASSFLSTWKNGKHSQS